MDRRRPGSARPVVAKELSGVLLRGLRDALRGAPMKASARKRLQALGLIEKNPDRFSRLTERGLSVLRAAKGMPAMPETGTGSAPKEGQPGPKGSPK